jgi:hypothetical protein
MRKALRRVKKAFTSSSPSHDSISHTRSDSMSFNSSQSVSYVSSPHRVRQLSYPPTQAGGMIDDDTDIPIRTYEELVRCESLHRQEYAHNRIYDVSLLERVGMDLELPIILHAVRWEKFFVTPHSGSRLLTLEFFTNFESFTRGRKSFVSFRLFRIEFEIDCSRFSEILDFFSSCLLDPRAIKNFSRVLCLRSQKNLAGLGLAISITLHLDSCIGGCPLRFSQWRNYILLLLLSLRASIPWYTRSRTLRSRHSQLFQQGAMCQSI